MTSTACCSRNFHKQNKPARLVLSVALITACVTFANNVNAQTLFSFGKYTVSKSEFLKSFEKNAPSSAKRKAMEEYLPLYINYKLKVRAGYDEKLDTLESQKEEASLYKQQLEEGFLLQRSDAGSLVSEAAERSKRDILLGHIFFPYNAADSQSIAVAQQKAQLAYSELKKGKSFGQVANAYNENATPADGVAGWITVFTLPYKYETAVYNAGKGGFTAPLKGSEGFHIFKQLSDRPSVGKVTVAQILLWLPEKPSPVDVALKEQLADSLYQSLLAGSPFEQLALQYSNDRTSYATGGILPEFGVGEYDAVFEDKAFSLEKPGSISKPFRTSFGIHILKLVKKQQLFTGSDSVEAYEKIRQQVVESGRQNLAKENYLRKMLPKMGFKQAPFKQEDLWRFSDSALKNASSGGNPIGKNTMLFSIGDEKILAENWIFYLRGIPRPGSPDARSYQQVWDQYILQSAEDHYKRNLNKYEPAFSDQMKEFKEANLLFQAMDIHVWSAAIADTTGLQQHYNAHKQQYKWQDGASALSVAGSDSVAVANFRNEMVKQPLAWRSMAGKYSQRLLADSGRFEMAQLPAERFNAKIQPGVTSEVYHNTADNSFSFTYIFEMKAGGDLRSFDEARGWVISDYQQVLEAKWIAALKKKYPVKVNEAVWQQMLKVN